MRRWRHLVFNHSLRAKMLVTILVITLFSLGVLALLYANTTRAALTGEANQTLYAAASRTAASIDTLIEANIQSIRSAAQLPEIIAYLSLPPEQRVGSPEEAAVQATLLALTRRDQFTISTYPYALLDYQGRNLVDMDPSQRGQDESGFDYFQVPLRTGLPFMSPVQFASDVGGVYFFFSSPVRSAEGQIVGILRVRHSVAILQSIVSESRGLAGEGSFAMLLDENLLRLAHDTAPHLIFKTIVPLDPARAADLRMARRLPNLPLEEMSTQIPAFAQGLENAAVQPFFAAEAHSDTTDLEQMAAIKLEHQPWFVVFAQPRRIFLAPIEHAVRATLVSALVVCGLVAIVQVVIAQLLTGPITRLTEVAERIAAGDLQAQAQVEAKDEIGQLARSFNNMTAQLRHTLAGLELRNEQLNQEIDERQQIEEALRQQTAELTARNAELDAFAHTVAHDLKNPVGIIGGFAQMLHDDAYDMDREDLDRYLQTIVRNSHKMESIIDELLLLAGVRQMQVEMVPLDMAAIVAQACERLSLTIKERQAMVVAPTAGDWPAALGYAPWVEEVWVNYISNALKYGGDPPCIELGFSMEKDQSFIAFWARDNGQGLSSEEKERLFTPFTQLPQRRGQGYGLGLSIVRRIVDKLEGKVKVESQVGQGSTFYFSLPQA